jgi:hypothetical protein
MANVYGMYCSFFQKTIQLLIQCLRLTPYLFGRTLYISNSKVISPIEPDNDNILLYFLFVGCFLPAEKIQNKMTDCNDYFRIL